MTDSATKPSSNGGSKASAAPDAAAATPPAATPAPGIAAIAAAEQGGCYRSFGPAYLGTGIAGDLSLEIGITTGTSEQQQRSGIGIYLRSDHVAHRYASQLLI